jgi:quinohemoprotein ethanol dehydrogenase
VLAGAMLAVSACVSTPPQDSASAALLADDSAGADWPGYGRTNGQQHFSPLGEIGKGNVDQLGLAWSMDLPPENSVTQPLAVDGVLYFAIGLSVVHAVDAASGKLLWSYDPQVGERGAMNMRTAWGVRGIAWWNGKIYTGTQDGRLIALDADTGKLLWSVQTLDPGLPAHVNGAPRVFNGKVIIGWASTMGVNRGYVTAYDAETGEKAWRFWTVPGDPSKGFENRAMEMAAKTWSGEWWKYGGGGSVWNSMAYDPETDTVFIGVGSPYPWSHRIRSEGKGDNLFIGAIVAIEMTTGEYMWHYQPTPGDTWDFDAVMDIELADLEIGGKVRKVLMQAPKNGFFYVIDRVTGEFISAEPYVKVNWASHVDPKTGRPVEVPGARFGDGKPVRITPTSIGGHNWMSMAYSPRTGLVYIPANHFEADYSDPPTKWEPSTDYRADAGVMILGGPDHGTKPASGSLLAWSPATQKPVWSVDYPTFLNGGALATAGDLVFQGTVDGIFRAYAADTGKLVWQFDTGAPILGTPISYQAGGKQYVTLLTGISMGIAMYAPTMIGPGVQKYAIDPMTQQRRVLTFVIGGKGKLASAPDPVPPPDDTGFIADPKRIAAGGMAFAVHCLQCHGDQAIGIGNGPDLRRSVIPLNGDAFERIVRDGVLETRGMPKYPEFSDQKLEDIRHYIRAQMTQLRSGTTKQMHKSSISY